jgi:hypothetical protein
MHALALWIGLGIALSPSLAELGSHWLAEPWTRYSALFVPLWILAARTDPGQARPRRLGFALVALGVAISVVAVGGGVARFGRLGIVLAAVGLAVALGAPALPRALVALFIVPVPSAVASALPGLEVGSARAAAWLAQAAGIEAGVRATPGAIELVGSSGSLALAPEHGGLPLAALIGGLGWYGAVRRGASTRSALGACARTAPWAVLVQPIGLACAAGLLFSGAPASARTVVDSGIWITTALVAGLVLLRSAPPGRTRRPLRDGVPG